jgi:hypothetical protein
MVACIDLWATVQIQIPKSASASLIQVWCWFIPNHDCCVS